MICLPTCSTLLIADLLTFRRLMIDPKQRKVIIAENAFMPNIVKQLICEVLFGNLQVPSVCFVPSHLLSTLAIGRTTSIVLDIGFHEATLLPIYHGRGLNHTHLLTSPRAGKRLAKRLRALLLHFGTYLPYPGSTLSSSNIAGSSSIGKGKIPAQLLTWDFLEEIKAKALIVGDFFDSESSNDVMVQPQDTRPDWTSGTIFSELDEAADHILMQVLESRYKTSSRVKDMTMSIPPLARGAVTPATQPSTLGVPSVPITTGRDSIVIPGWIRERAAEVLFESGDEDELSLVDMILRTLLKLPIDLRTTLASNIYISGGTAMLPGLAHRIRKEVIQRLEVSQKEGKEGLRPDMIALSLPRVGPAKSKSTKGFEKPGVIDTIEEKEEVGVGPQIITSDHSDSLLTMESKQMKQRRSERQRFECKAISSLASSIAVLNDHAPRIDAEDRSMGGIAPYFPANLSTWIGGSLMGSLRIGVVNEMSRDIWDEEQEEIEAAKTQKNTDGPRPGLVSSKRGSFLGTVGGLDTGTYGALSSGARGTFANQRSPSK
jgi:actin-related protein 10